MDQAAIDAGLNELDGTDNKGNLGANAVLAVSLAVAKAAAGVSSPNGSLWHYLAAGNPVTLPVPMFNILNGGKHAATHYFRGRTESELRARLAPIVARMSSNRALRPALRSAIAATPPKGLMDAMRAALRFDGRPLVGQLTMPVLSLIGTSSILTGAADRAAFDTVKLFETGHMLPFDLPDAVADEILTFLEGLT